ncbi:MAG TPA: TonB-dependent receptor, partial [Burkholderiales bacterium]|nr:TonB-dependent receptor [Burkholderiales bacterium]
LALVLGFQATQATRKFNDELQPLRNFKNTYDGFSPRVGALYEFGPGLQVFSNVSGVYEPPSFGELVQAVIQPRLRAQKGTSYEVGSRGQLGGGWWDFAYYYVDLKDELLTQRNNIGQTLTLNVPATYHQGIEFAGLLPLPADFYLRGSYLWNDFRFDDDLVFGNNRLPGIPPQYVQAEVGWSRNELYAALFTEWVPEKYPVDMVNAVFADPYATLGAKVGQRRRTGFSWFVEGRNLTDQKFAATTGVTLDARLPGANRQFNPGDGRAFYAGIEWNL